MRTSLFYSIGLLLLLVFSNSHATTPDNTAEEIVKDTADKVIARLTAERAELEVRPEKLYSLINEIIIPHFDFVSMSKWVLGKNWKSATEAQQTRFVEQFRTLLVRTYAKALLEFSDQEINYLPVINNPDSNIVVVKTEVQQPGAKSVPINYSLHISGGSWKVVDVSVDGISLVATYRGSFASEIRKGGFDALIAKLAERNSTATDMTASQ